MDFRTILSLFLVVIKVQFRTIFRTILSQYQGPIFIKKTDPDNLNKDSKYQATNQFKFAVLILECISSTRFMAIEGSSMR